MSVEHCNVTNEHTQLKAVVVGTAESWGPNPTPEEAVDPKSRFERVNYQLRAWGYRVIETKMDETSKMGGLLRCVTLPIQ